MPVRGGDPGGARAVPLQDPVRTLPMRNARIAILGAVLIAAAYFGYRVYDRHAQSPFAYGLARAGERYDSYVAALKDSSQDEPRCADIVAGYRICRGTLMRPQSAVIVVVDPRGRVVLLDQRIVETSTETRLASTELAKRWTEEGPATPVKRPDAADVKRWSSDDNRWSATMSTRGPAHALDEVVLTDEKTLSTLSASALPTLLVLSREGLVGPELVDATERRAPGALAKAADRLAAGGRPSATAASQLPACGPQAALGIDPGMARRTSLGASAEIVTQAMAQRFPDRRLELRDSVYLVDADGVPELIEVTDPVPVRNGTAVAFAVNYSGRASAVASRIQTFDAASCRAPAEVIVARLDRSRTKVTGIERVTPDEEALASRVVEMRTTANGKGQRLLVHTVGTYGATEWYGEVDWMGAVAIDTLRVLDRWPVTLAKIDSDSRVAAVDLEPIVARGDAPRSSVGGKRVTAVVQAHGGSRAQPLFLPTGPEGRPDGWAMLTVL